MVQLGQTKTYTANIVPIGLTPVTYLWSTPINGTINGSNTGSSVSITWNTVGTEDVEVLITSECNSITQTFEETIFEVTPLVASFTKIDRTCPQGLAGSVNDGSIDVTVSGGTAPYTYNWGFGQPTTQDRVGLATGTYPVTITDVYGQTVTLNPVIGAGIMPTVSLISPNNLPLNGANPVITISNSLSQPLIITYNGIISGTITVPAANLPTIGTNTITVPTTTMGLNTFTVTQVEFVNGGGCINTQPFNISYTVHNGTGGTIQASGAVVGCAPFNPGIINTVTAGIVDSPGTLSYQWRKQELSQGWVNLVGETGLTYTPANITVTTSFQRLTVSTIGSSTLSFGSNIIGYTINC